MFIALHHGKGIVDDVTSIAFFFWLCRTGTRHEIIVSVVVGIKVTAWRL